jgi:hypothetical protein
MKIELVESTLIYNIQLTKKNTHYISQKLITHTTTKNS